MKRRNQNTKQKASSEPKRQRTTSPVARQSSTRGSKSPPLPITYLATFSLADQSFAYVLSSSIIAQSPYLESAINLQTPKKRQGPIVSLTIPLNEAFETYWPGQDPKTVFPCLERALSFLSLGFQTDVWRLVDQETMGLIVTLRGLAKFLQMSVPPLNVSSMDMTDPSRWLLIDTFDVSTVPALFDKLVADEPRKNFMKAYRDLPKTIQSELYKRLFTPVVKTLVKQFGYHHLYCEISRITFRSAHISGLKLPPCSYDYRCPQQARKSFLQLHPSMSIETWSHGLITVDDLKSEMFMDIYLIGDISPLVLGGEPCKILYTVTIDRESLFELFCNRLTDSDVKFVIAQRDDYDEFIIEGVDLVLRVYESYFSSDDHRLVLDNIVMEMPEIRYEACLHPHCMTLRGSMGFVDLISQENVSYLATDKLPLPAKSSSTSSSASSSTSSSTATSTKAVSVSAPHKVIVPKLDVVADQKRFEEKVEQVFTDNTCSDDKAVFVGGDHSEVFFPIPRWNIYGDVYHCPTEGLAWRSLSEDVYIASHRTSEGLRPFFIRADDTPGATKYLLGGNQVNYAFRLTEILKLIGISSDAKLRNRDPSIPSQLAVRAPKQPETQHLWYCIIGLRRMDSMAVSLHHPSVHFADWTRVAFDPSTPLKAVVDVAVVIELINQHDTMLSRQPINSHIQAVPFHGFHDYSIYGHDDDDEDDDYYDSDDEEYW